MRYFHGMLIDDDADLEQLEVDLLSHMIGAEIIDRTTGQCVGVVTRALGLEGAPQLCYWVTVRDPAGYERRALVREEANFERFGFERWAHPAE